MKERQYKESFRLVTQLDERTGKPRQIAVYSGKYYRYARSRAGMRRFFAASAALCLGQWALLIAYLVLGTPSTSCLWVLPVMSMNCFPALYWALGCASQLRAPERMTIVQRESGTGRVLHSALGCTIASALACAGDIVFVALGGAPIAHEWPGLALMLLSLAVSALALHLARRAYRDIAPEE